MNTKLSVSAVLAAVIGFASWSSANACSYESAESADTAQNVAVAATKVESSPFSATDVDTRTSTDIRSGGAARGANQDGVAKGRPGPAKMFQLRDAAGG